MPARRNKHEISKVSPYKASSPRAMAAVLPPVGMNHWLNMGAPTPLTAWEPQTDAYQPHSTVAPYHPPTPAPAMTPQSLKVPASKTSASRARRPSTSQGNYYTEFAWTREMDNILLQAQASGLRWEQISQHYFPHKSANACRKRFARAREERKSSDWDEDRVQRVLLAYNRDDVRERMWSMVSQEAGETWEDVERWCFSQGLVKMTRSKKAHARKRSHSSRLSMTNTADEPRYHSPSNDDHDGMKGTRIGLGLAGQSSYHVIPTTRGQVATDSVSDPALHVHHDRYQYGP